LTRSPRFGRLTGAIAFVVSLAVPIFAIVNGALRRRARHQRPEIRVVLEWDANRERMIRMFEGDEVYDDDELGERMRGALERFTARGVKSIPVVIEPDPKVEWEEVLRVTAIARSKGFKLIETTVEPSEAGGGGAPNRR
jgi:hypothetical protein